MILLKLCRNVLARLLVALVIISSLAVPPAFCQDTEDSQVFIAGFNAYQQKDYASAIEKMNEVLQKYPDTPLRDMALFWLSRSYFKAGNQQEAARYLSQFSKEYPDNPLKSTVESELLALTTRYDKGERLTTGSPPIKQPVQISENDRIAAVKAEEAKLAAASEATRLAALKQADEEAAKKKEQERIAQETAAREKAEQLRIAAIKSEESRKAAEAEQQRAASAKAEKEKLAAAAEAEQARMAAAKAKETQQAAAEAARIAAKKTESERIALAKAEEAKKAAAAKAEQDRLAAAKAKETQQAEAAAEAAQIAARKAESERIALDKAEEAKKAAAESARLAALKTEETRLAQQKIAEEKAKEEKLAYRERAIAQFKATIDKFPRSSAAVTAAAKLRELGIAVALPPEPVEAPLPENAQVLQLEVAQFAGFEFQLLTRPEAFKVGHLISIPFELVNRGNGSDSFNLESAFPADFKAHFTSSAAPGVAVSHTPALASGEIFKGNVELTIPSDSIDGLRIAHPVKAVSRLIAEASQSREIKLTASAPLLRAVVRTDKTKLLPGSKVIYRIAILNVGSTVAKDVTFRLNYPAQLEPVDYAAMGFKLEMQSALALDRLQISSGESREFSITFQVKGDSLAGQELTTRAELINNQLKTSAAFVSNAAYVETQRNIFVRSGSNRMAAIPGQTITVPYVVANRGNIREKFKISSIVSGVTNAVIFSDVNRKGIRQTGEQSINEIGPLAPGEEAGVVVEIKTPSSANDGGQGNVQVLLVSEGDAARSASDSTQLIYSRPVLKMAMTGRDGRLKPGDVASFDLVITNNGSNLAKIVELQSAWPEQLELIAANPVTSAVNNGTVTWRFKEMGATEKRIIKVSFRVKPVAGAGTAIKVKNILTYEDQLGNRY